MEEQFFVVNYDLAESKNQIVYWCFSSILNIELRTNWKKRKKTGDRDTGFFLSLAMA